MKNLTYEKYITPIYLFFWLIFVLLTYEDFLRDLNIYNFSYSLNNKYIFFSLCIIIFLFPIFFSKEMLKKITYLKIATLIIISGSFLLTIYNKDPNIFLQAPDTGTYYNLYFYFFGCDENILYECKDTYNLNHRLPSLPLLIGLLSFLFKFEWVPLFLNFFVLVLWYLFPYFVFRQKDIRKAHYGTILTTFFPLISVFGYLVLTDALFTILFWIWFIKIMRRENFTSMELIPYVSISLFLILLRPEGILFVALGIFLTSLVIRQKIIIIFVCLIVQVLWGQIQVIDIDRYLYVNIVPKTYQYQQDIGYDQARNIANNEYVSMPYSLNTIIQDEYPVSLKDIVKSQKKWIPANLKFSWNQQYANLPNAFFYFQYLYFAPFLLFGFLGLLSMRGKEKRLGYRIVLISIVWILMTSILGPVDITRFNLFINLPLIIGLSHIGTEFSKKFNRKNRS